VWALLVTTWCDLSRSCWAPAPTQYRSEIFYTNEEQKRVAEAYIQQLTAAKAFRKPIVTKVAPLQAFYRAEDYHQDFVARNPYQPYVARYDVPKLARLREELAGISLLEPQSS
jgi:peptide-methionine (S)-S-oxide reductase